MHTTVHTECTKASKAPRKWRLCNRSLRELLSLAAAAVLLLGIYLLIGCPIRLLTGIACPGCGITRAWLSLLRLDLGSAFYYHPLWVCPLLFLPVWFLLRPRHRRLYQLAIGIFILLFLGVYGFRLASGSPIVTPELPNGLIFRAIHPIL